MRKNLFLFLLPLLFYNTFDSFSQVWTANNDTYNATGYNGDGLGSLAPAEGLFINVPAARGVKTNDVANGGPAGTVDAAPVFGPLNGVLVCADAGDARNGNAGFCSNGSFKYTHNSSETTTETITYTITNATGKSGTGTVTITITPVNDPPSIGAYQKTIAEGSGVNSFTDLESLVNDPDNNPGDYTFTLAPVSAGGTNANSSIAGVNQAWPSTYGAVIDLATDNFASTGDFKYTAPGALPGNDQYMDYFEVTVSDGALNATATFKIFITNSNPSGVNDTYEVNFGETRTFATPGVLGNDPLAVSSGVDPGACSPCGAAANKQVKTTVSQPSPNDVIKCTDAGDPNNASNNFCKDGGFTYEHKGLDNNLTKSALYFMNDGFDDAGAVTTVNFNINLCPVGGTGDVYEVIEGGTLNVNQPGTAATPVAGGGVIFGTPGAVPGTGVNLGKKTAGTVDSDGNPGEVLSAVLSGAPPAHATSFTLNPNGTFSYVHNGTEPNGGNAQVTFQYTLHDGPVPYDANTPAPGCTAKGPYTVTINIIPQNDCPDCDSDTYTIPEGFAINANAANGFIQGGVGALGGKKTAGAADLDRDVPANTLTAVQEGGNPAGFVPGTWLFNATGAFTYTHNMDPGVGAIINTTTFKYKIGDNGVDPACPPAAGEECTVTIIIQNVAPVVDNDDYACGTANAVKEGRHVDVSAGDGILTGDVFNNPFDPKTISVTDAPDFGVLTCEKVGDPNVGTNNFCSDGSFRYTHTCTEANDGNNVETIKYKIHDGFELSNEGTVTICIEDECPVAEVDNYLLLVDDGGTLNADGIGTNPEGVLLRNDGIDQGGDGVLIDAEPRSCDKLTVAIKTLPVGGIISCQTAGDPNDGDANKICTDGTFRYIDNVGGAPTTSFTYTLNGGNECSVDNITVNLSVNQCPVGATDTYTVAEGATLTINTAAGAGGGVILGTVGGAKTVGVADTDPNGTPLTVASAGINNRGIKTGAAPTKGTIVCEKGGDPNLGAAPSICSDGTFKYIHGGDEPVGAGPHDTFQYILTDGVCQVDVVVNIVVTETNDCPVGVADGYAVDEGQTININSKAGNDGGVILGTTNVVKIAGGVDADIDSDPNTLTATIVGGSGPNNHDGVFTLNANGTFIYTHDGGASITDSFQYTLNDQEGCAASTPITVTITITPTNDCPVGSADTYNVDEGGTLTLDDHDNTATPGNANDNGVKANDAGDEETNKYVLGWEIVQAPQDHLGNPMGVVQNQTANGNIQYVHDGTEMPDAPNNFVTFTYRYIDALCVGGPPPPITVTITINPINNCPVARSDSYLLVIDEAGVLNAQNTNNLPARKGVVQNNNPNAIDSDPEGDNFDAVLKPGSGPFRGTLVCNTFGDDNFGNSGICENGDFVYTHDGLENHGDQFSYYAVDPTSTCQDDPNFRSETTVSITVNPVNDCPVAIDDAYTVNENETITADGQGANPKGVKDKQNVNQANAIDSDAEGDAFTVALKPGNGPVNATSLTCPSNAIASPTICPDGTFQYVHNGTETISDQFIYVITPTVACAVGGDLEGLVTITIVPQPDCPILVGETETVVEGGTLTGNGCAGGLACDVSANDDNGGVALKAYVITQQPTLGSIVLNPNGTFTYTHFGAQTPLQDIVKYQTNNGQCNSNEETLTINITPANNPPVGVIDIYTVTEGGNININDPFDAVTPGVLTDNGVLINDTDPDFTPPTNPFKDDPLHVHQVVKQPDYYDAAAAGQPFTVADNGTFIYFQDGTHDGTPGFKDTFTYMTRDGNCVGQGTCPTTEVTINITSVNDCPIGENDIYVINEDDLLSADGSGGSPQGVLLHNDGNDSGTDGILFDFDEESDLITCTQFGPNPLHGVFNFFPNGTFTYDHDGSENFTGIFFQYTINDNQCGGGESPPIRVDIVVNAVNECPSVNDQTYPNLVLEGGETIVIEALGLTQGQGADTDPEGDNLSASVVVNPQFGTLTCPPPPHPNGTGQPGVCQDGSFKYEHDGSENHTDTFTYKQSDGDPACNVQGTVTITINPVNDPPVANDDLLTYSVNEGQTLNITDINLGVRKNDSDPEQDVMDVAQVTLDWNCAGCTGPTHATQWTPNPDGTFFYKHDGTDPVNVDEITYRLDDNQAENNLSELPLAIVRIRIINTLPVALGEDYTVDKCETLLANDTLGINAGIADGVLVNDSDVDPQDKLITQLVTGTTHGTLSCVNNLDNNFGKLNNICEDGSFQYVHNGTAAPTTDSFTYNVNDGEASTVVPVTATITIVNRAPIPAVDEYTILEGASLTVTAGGGLGVEGLKDNDTDANSCDVLTVTMKTPPLHHNENSSVVMNPNDPCLTLGNNVNCVTGGPFEAQTDGAFAYAHDGSETIIDSIMYRVSDGTITSAATKAIIHITPVNDPPIARNDTFELFECDTLIVDVAGGLKKNDEDVDNPIASVDVLVAHTDLPTQGTLKCGGLMNTPCLDGSFQYIHNGNDKPNLDSFRYRLFDNEPGDGKFSVDYATVIIVIKNRPPPGAQNENYSVKECKVLITDAASGVLANDTDPDCKDVLTIVMKDLPAMGSFIYKDDGSFTYSHDCTDNPDNTYFTYFVTDGEDTTSVADTAFIAINNVCTVGNDDLYENILEGGKLIVNADSGVLHNDNDQNPLDPVTLVAPMPLGNGSGPYFGTLTLNADGSFDYVHDDSENFEDEFKYVMNDGECDNDTVKVSIRITPVPDTPPVALADTYPCIDEDSVLQTLTYLEGVLGNDYDLDEKDSVLTAVIVTLPLNGSLILNPNGTFIYNHDGGETTTDSFTYYATDGDFNTDTVTVTLCINPVNDCPVPVNDVFNINEGQDIDSSLVLNDSDIEILNGIDNNELIISVLDQPKNVDGDIVGNLYWTPDGTFRYNPPRHIEAPGPEVVTFDYALSDDGFVLCDSTATVTITIAHINDCPFAVNDTLEFDASSPVSLIKDLIVNDFDIDSDLDSTSIEILRNPDFGEVIVNNDGTITYNFENSPTNFDTLIYTVRDIEGCASNQGYLFIHAKNLNPTIYELPNYFTPNSDLFNDFFVAKYQNILEKYIGFKVRIYDRYERVIFSSDSVSTDVIWNGNDNLGQPVQSDFYYFEVTPVEYRGTKYERSKDILVGTVYLERKRVN